MEKRLKVGITHGDVNGVSYELIIKLLDENKMCELCMPIVYGSPKVVSYYRKVLNAENFNLNPIKYPGEANPKRSSIIHCVDDQVKVDIGTETEESATAAMKALEYALGDLDKKEIEVLTLTPQGERGFVQAGSRDILEFLSKRYPDNEPVSLLVNDRMKVGFVTGNIYLKDVPPKITTKSVLRKLQLLNESLKLDFTLTKPRIAVLGVNPKINCENKMEEEGMIILPALEKARQQGIMAVGPFAADQFFGEELYTRFDAILAMYHDQGAIPFRALGTTPGAAYVAGLPVVCTYPLDDPGYEKAGQGTADEQGVRDALYLGMDIYANRKQNLALRKNPLPHYNISSNSNETDLNVDQIEGVTAQTDD